MRKILLVLAVLLVAAPLTQAGPIKLGVGAYGGLNFPIIMDDQASGSVFGFHARVPLASFVVIEPNVMFGKWGQADPVEGIVLPDGSKLSSFGVDLVLGGAPGLPGFKPYFFGGIGTGKVKNDETGFDYSGVSYSVGLGFLVAFKKIDVDVRARAWIAAQENGGAKKAIMPTIGFHYYFNLGK